MAAPDFTGPRDDNGDPLPAHEYVDDGKGACLVCGESEDDELHEIEAENKQQASWPGLRDDVVQRLISRYTLPRGAVKAAAKVPVNPPGYDAESEIIAKNSKTVQAQQPHRFQRAEYTMPNGHPRCMLCGSDEPLGGVCNDAAGGAPVQDLTPKHAIPVMSSESANVVMHTTHVSERAPIPLMSKPSWIPDSPGFITEANGKTLVTAQATVDPALFEKAYSPNDFFMWTQGRLVGAEEANRNGAFWTSGDLELGQATVKYGPLNWLHDGRHVIGTMAEAAFVAKPEQADDNAFTQPHIAVVAPVWKWLYPDEADVIQMASEANKFWYSMECISKAVECVGEGGCGAQAEYADYIQGGPNSCEHMRDRSATRRFVDPTFLGAAVIVPPVRPGWAEANASVRAQAASMAEKAYEQAGKPDVTASEWELLMGQVLAYSAT